MNTLVDQPISASYSRGRVLVRMQNGLDFSFPIRGNLRLEGKAVEKLKHIELSPFGLHWPDLDEDLSIRGILEGRYGQRKLAIA